MKDITHLHLESVFAVAEVLGLGAAEGAGLFGITAARDDEHASGTSLSAEAGGGAKSGTSSPHLCQLIWRG